MINRSGCVSEANHSSELDTSRVALHMSCRSCEDKDLQRSHCIHGDEWENKLAVSPGSHSETDINVDPIIVKTS